MGIGNSGFLFAMGALFFCCMDACNFSGSMGAFFLSIMFGTIADVTHSFNVPLFIVAGVLFAGCLSWLLVDAGKPLAEVKKNEYIKFIKNIQDAAQPTAYK